jgi:hypothetical protein
LGRTLGGDQEKERIRKEDEDKKVNGRNESAGRRRKR